MADATQRAPMRRGREPSMDLPAGWTCGGCQHFQRCNAIFGHIAADETCDFSPSRFRPAQVVVDRAVRIADTAMFEQLRDFGVPYNDKAHIGIGGEKLNEVLRLDDAGAAFREAFDWLQPRGYVELANDDAGEFVRVLRKPGGA